MIVPQQCLLVVLVIVQTTVAVQTMKSIDVKIGK